jgi:hypothetical protein
MTDHDRGAYTPQTDAPLAFDARHSRGGGGGGPAPMTLIVSAIVLLLLIIALLLFYRSGVRHTGQAPQVVGAPVAQTKTAPPPADASAAPSGASGLQIYKSDGTPPPPAAPTFAPAPEQPEARPAPPPVAAPVAPVASASLRPAQTATAPAATPPPPAPKAQSAPVAPKAEGAPTPAAKPTKVASLSSAKPKAEAASTSAAGEPLVQIGAFSSAALAEKGWNDTALVVPGKMAGKTSKVEKADRDGKTFYRAFVGGFSSHTEAVSFCVALKAAGKQCMVR